jgi:hypothetical protein
MSSPFSSTLYYTLFRFQFGSPQLQAGEGPLGTQQNYEITMVYTAYDLHNVITMNSIQLFIWISYSDLCKSIRAMASLFLCYIKFYDVQRWIPVTGHGGP